MSEANTVYVIDDDLELRVTLSAMVQALGYRYHPFSSGQDFIDSLDHLQSGCVLIDLCMPEMNGLGVLEAMSGLQNHIPAILITGQGDIPTTVCAMKLGARDVLLKPFTLDRLGQVLRAALATIENTRDVLPTSSLVSSFADLLTERQLDVLTGMIDGLSNKQIAAKLDIAPRTVEMHRAKLMEKLGVRNLAEVLRRVMHGNPNDRPQPGHGRTRAVGF